MYFLGKDKLLVAPVVTYEIEDKRPMSEIAITVGKGNRTPVVNNFRSLALEKLPTFPKKC